VSVTVHYQCGGCDAKAEGTEPLRMEFRSFSGRDYGFGSAIPANSADSVAPKGWVPFDPYTYCCYCPKCWAEIDAATDAEASDDAGELLAAAINAEETSK